MTLSYYGNLGMYGTLFVGSIGMYASINQYINYSKTKKIANIYCLGVAASSGLLFADQLLNNNTFK